jgi:chromosome segregation ATPase
MSSQEIEETQRKYRELAARLAAQSRALEAVDWADCNSELDRLRRAARDASDNASEVESAKSEYESCRDERRRDCSSERSQYEGELQGFTSELDTVVSRYKGALSSCGNR